MFSIRLKDCDDATKLHSLISILSSPGEVVLDNGLHNSLSIEKCVGKLSKIVDLPKIIAFATIAEEAQVTNLREICQHCLFETSNSPDFMWAMSAILLGYIVR